MNTTESSDVARDFIHDCAAELGFPANRSLRDGLFELIRLAAQEGADLSGFRDLVLEDYAR